MIKLDLSNRTTISFNSLLTESIDSDRAAKKIVSFLIGIIGKIIENIVKALTWIVSKLIKGFTFIRDKFMELVKQYKLEKVREVTLRKSYRYNTTHIPSLEDFNNFKIMKVSVGSDLKDCEDALRQLSEVVIDNKNGSEEDVILKFTYKDTYNFIDRSDRFLKDSERFFKNLIDNLEKVKTDLLKHSQTPEGKEDLNSYRQHQEVIEKIRLITTAKIKFIDLVKTAGIDHLTATIKAKDKEIEALKKR